MSVSGRKATIETEIGEGRLSLPPSRPGPREITASMAPSSSSSKAQASTSSSTPFAKLYNGSFLPSSLGNAVACYSSATFAGEHDSNSSSKGKGKSTAGKSSKGKGAAAGSDDGDVKFVEFDTLKRSRRTVSVLMMRTCRKPHNYNRAYVMYHTAVHNRNIYRLCQLADHSQQVPAGRARRC